MRRWRSRHWPAELARLEALSGIGDGQRAFLVGNGPSISRMDLSRLDGEFVCLTNLGIRALGGALSHADIHLVMDTHRYGRFRDEIEARAAAIPYRFLNMRSRWRWRGVEGSMRPHFLMNNPVKLAIGRSLPDLRNGLVTASSVLVSAAVLLDHLGFEAIHVIGCDLDYETSGTYFYASAALDAVHEADPAVRAKRANMTAVNGEFAILRACLEAKGKRIVNSGVGGNLESLSRISFDTIFGDT